MLSNYLFTFLLLCYMVLLNRTVHTRPLLAMGFFFFLQVSYNTQAHSISIDSLTNRIASVAAKSEELSLAKPVSDNLPLAPKRKFESLEASTSSPVFLQRDFYIEEYARPVTTGEDEIRQQIEATFEKVVNENRFIDFLDENSLLDLPVGLKVDLGVLRYIILVDSVVMTPRESFLYASMLFETPQGKRIHFKGSEIKFSKTGGLSGDGKLVLVGDYPINLDGDKSKLIIKGSQEKTFVEFDCSGFKQMSIDGSLVFSREILEPETGNGNVAVNFNTTVTDWNDILLNVTVAPFRVTGLKNFTFSITDAVLDFSDTRNAAAVKFPAGYAETSTSLIDGNMNLWRGVYIRELSITLPPQFETKNEQGQDIKGTGHRVSFKGNDLLLDNMGFSGRVSGNNLIPINKGKIGNWSFSLETIFVDINVNEIREAGFYGRVNIPIANKNEEQLNPSQPTAQKTQKANSFNYRATIKPGNEYTFTVSNPDTLRFDLWKADVTLHPSSYIEVALMDDKFRPKAYLNGLMTVNLGLKDDGNASADAKKNVKLANLSFQDLEIQTIKPYITVGSFSLGMEGGNSGMGGFPIFINEIYGSSNADELTIGIDLTLALIGEQDGGFAANGRFGIVSEGIETDGDLKYRFKRINIERFGIDIDKGAFKFKGTLNFYKEDPVYGNGISGTIDATFGSTFQLQASAIFGTRNGMRYWYADALARFQSGVTIFPGVAFYSFGGGAYYHMKMDNQGVGSALGRTVSGIVYVPDEKVAFGFKATVSLGIQPGEQAFNAEVTYEMAFNTGGGVKYINFRGNGYFMTPPVPNDIAKLQEKATKLAAAAKKAGVNGGNLNVGNSSSVNDIHGSPAEAGQKAQVWASAMINYDFDNNILHGNLKAYVNVAAGIIKGGGPNGLAGEAVLHFAPGEWYIYIGRPEYENRFAIEVLGIARLDAYFVIGSVIPDSPPPPENVSSILGGVDLDYMKELNALSDGAGVGFGASFRVDTGDLSFLIFYGRFAAGLGFDIMIKDYGDVQCKGGGRLGINGWYANGQAYAYFEGTIGIQVKLFGRSKKITILDIAAAVVAQAKLPNPTWVRGIAGGRFSVLGGLVKGSCKFEIEIGKDCEIVRNGGSVLETVEVLAQVTPEESTKDVDVFTAPQAVFNYEMEREYEMVDEVTSQIVRFKISLDHFKIKDGAADVQADLMWNDDKTVAALNPFEILPSEKELVLEIVTSFKEFKGGYWVVTEVNGEKLKKTYSYKFSTAKAPEYIPPGNVAYSYPTINQYNYYQNESREGYIKLKQGQSALFAPSQDWNQVVRFATSTRAVDLPFTYVASAKELRLNMPNDFTNGEVYTLSVVNVPKSILSSIDTNVDTTRTASSELGIGVRERSAQGTIKEVQEKEIYKTQFRTSKYNTFRDKVLSVNPSTGWRDPIMTGVHAIGSNISGPEPFSEEEIVGINNNPPLVQMEADLNNVPWYNDKVFPLVYEGYPVNGIFRIRPENRNPDILGIVPTKSVFLYQYPYRIKLSESELTTGTVALPSTVGRIDYYLAYYMFYDYIDLANQAANYVVGRGGNDRINMLITTPFPVITLGNYWVNIHYTLPGRNTVTSSYRHKIYNPID
jgi:hypothetical protein